MSSSVSHDCSQPPEIHASLVNFVNEAQTQERIELLQRKYAPAVFLLNTSDEHWKPLGWLVDNARHLLAERSPLRREGTAIVVCALPGTTPQHQESLHFLAFPGDAQISNPDTGESLSLLALTRDLLASVHFRTQERIGLERSGELCGDCLKCRPGEYYLESDPLRLLEELIRGKTGTAAQFPVSDIPADRPKPAQDPARAAAPHPAPTHTRPVPRSFPASEVIPEELEQVSASNPDSFRIIAQAAEALTCAEVCEYLLRVKLRFPQRIFQQPELYPAFPYIVAASRAFNIPLTAMQDLASALSPENASENFGRSVLRTCEKMYRQNGTLNVSAVASVLSSSGPAR